MSNEEYVYEDPETTEAEVTPELQASKSGGSTAINFITPPGMNPNDLTLENYREVTGHRFRMTKDQKDVRGLSRANAFAESKALAVSQLEVK